jgi:ABC-type antimicrobial peptide transport system permease subunit
VALVLALALQSGIQNTLFNVRGTDWTSYLAVAALVTVVAFAAALVPARRATRVDPIIALRAE